MYKRLIALLIVVLLFSCGPQVVKKEIGEEKPVARKNTIPAYVLPETVNLRQQANPGSSVIRQLTGGEPVYVSKNINGWYEVQTEDGQKGFIRSDLVGPRSLSYTTLASAFVDSVLPNFRAEMFFDKTDLYKTVYITLKPEYYASQTRAKDMARKIGKAYQQKVYPGAVELRILKPNGKDLFAKVKLRAKGIDALSLPVLPFGRLIRVDNQNSQVALYIAVPDSVTDKALLKTARKISSHFGYEVSKIEIYFANDTAEGLALLNKLPGGVSARKGLCRLYYLEDKDGEYYKFASCGVVEKST